MVQSLALPAGISFSFALQNTSTSTAGFSDRRVLFLRKNTRRASIYAAAVAEAPPALKRRTPASLYEVLRVKENASAKEIKAAYRNLAKLYHPDAASRPEESSDDRHFIEIHDAYVTLSDPVSRALYDVKLSAVSPRRGFGSSDDGVRIYGSEFYPARRWETDQCW
ncbi:chaperone protein dnaJ 11, chloroplastic-like [Nicotiana tabacum]|uniref:Chaperone protein dnaJ 11, chloroplastic-like n=2 Tax=Nicotiana TaxID=4085 RepID=A0A1S3XLM3_TOBAC|nr:PREDICTED: chaperone protein dnaJ 11, chloroplastic-like [Nicotiana sylvestris]XP_016440890.1 PREDICTED: chaperone protein dnaJ 11, chloroplastic-like [Nicotiana tabacum]